MPEPFTRLTSHTFVLPHDSIDTDQIIPARFLTTTTREGLGAKAFYDWRYDANGNAVADEPLNTLDANEHRILVAGDNFGCGSSREHAPWALLDYGFRAVISTQIADIFTSNALTNGLLPITIDSVTHARLMKAPGAQVAIDLELSELALGNELPVKFAVEPFARKCLIEDVDTLGWLLNCLPEIERFESRTT
ncbi:MAG: 3-isopropylmalate dehydratase small subunit [Caulobacteraceae bacterium]